MKSSDAETKNPCFKESRLSLDCLERHAGSKSACGDYIGNYKACRDFWYQVSRKRQVAGIRPTLPDPEDRAAFKAAYRKTGKIPATLEGA